MDKNRMTSLESGNDLAFTVGAWFRYPFVYKNLDFAFQPELSLGGMLHFAKDDKDSYKDGIYFDSLIKLSASLRFIPDFWPELNRRLEFEFTPILSFMPEKNVLLTEFGFRLGAVWHLDEPYRGSSLSSEKTAAVQEEKKALAEAELQSRREAVQKYLDDTQKSLGVSLEQLTDFTPDGDGVNDTVVLKPDFSVLSDSVKSWVLQINDPAGNPFYTLKGKGSIPETIEWDGKGNNGDTVYSHNTYKATLTAALGPKDKRLLQIESVSARADIKTGTVVEAVTESEWKISIQSLVFDANAATFNSLSKEQLEEMNKVLDDVVRQIMSIPGAKVTVYGYANNVSNTEKENVEELIPISQARAETIAKMLVERGVPKDQVSAEGMGGANPIAAWEDTANWWKNRRIEFVIKR